jgi:RHS repeat-associated protein
MEYCLSGFNGQRPDPVSRHSHLGNGYRAYNPVLGRFTAPDSMSPFGAGGINPYAYCAGDPVNRADPSGHFSLGQGLGMALGLVGGFVLGVLTEGMALPVVASLLANMAGDAAIGALSELATEAVDGQQINGRQVGMAALINAGFSLAGFGLGRLSKLKGTSNRPFGGLMMMPDSTTEEINTVDRTLSLNSRNLHEQWFTGPLYRVEKPTIDTDNILANGFTPSRNYGAVKKMLPSESEALIVSGSKAGATKFNQKIYKGNGRLFEISGNTEENVPLHVKGVSLNENFRINRENLRQHLSTPEMRVLSFADQDDLTRYSIRANEYDEIHVYLDQIRVENITELIE